MQCDTFQTGVYYAAEPDLFLTVNWEAEAESGDYVVTERHEGGEITLQLYHGQRYIGRANILEFYRLQHSTQWTPRQTRAQRY